MDPEICQELTSTIDFRATRLLSQTLRFRFQERLQIQLAADRVSFLIPISLSIARSYDHRVFYRLGRTLLSAALSVI